MSLLFLQHSSINTDSEWMKYSMNPKGSDITMNNTAGIVGCRRHNSECINTSSDLASLFECPVCFDYVLPPIIQCQSGHLVCSNCRPKLSCCSTCRGPLGNIRNLAMEKVAETVTFPCRYNMNGCTAMMLHTG